MDDAWKAYFSSLLLTTALLGSLASAVDLEYITPAQSQELADRFSGARLTDSDRQELATTKRNWSCDMFGMRTRLQVQRGLKLYEFQPASSAGQLKNGGAQPIESYTLENGALVGRSARVQDRVRVTGHGELISQLSLSSAPNSIIAYSLCHPL